MNKTILISLLVLLLYGCSSDELTDTMTQSGVSWELAEHRKNTITNVEYDLFFNVPSELTQDLNATLEVRFITLIQQSIILDFVGDLESISSVKVNGIDAKYQFVNEHIIISKDDIVKGDINRVNIDFIAPSLSLNRTEEYLYTLLVPDRARTLFPCFDQPNMKARYTLSLQVPQGWTAVSNTNVKSNNKSIINFNTTEPLSTYLFSFVAGVFDKVTKSQDGHTISIYHREKDPYKVEQLGAIYDDVFHSLSWLEEYTKVDYPFSKYDLIIIPNFQYGGMEHVGATLYKDKSMFLDKKATINTMMDRSSLIAHETAHMWFGDLVTMDWFNDVWTKEVFANYFASLMVIPQYPQIDHELELIVNLTPAAYTEDRTDGTNPIIQQLDNMQDAGLLYGSIIYDKSPIVMSMMVEAIGEDNFRKGINEYLTTYAYSNATWDDLISILDNLTPIDLKSWSDNWVKEQGMPIVSSVVDDGYLLINQADKKSLGILWEQEIEIMAIAKGGKREFIRVKLDSLSKRIKLPSHTEFVIMNSDGVGYGYFELSSEASTYMLDGLSKESDNATKAAFIVALYENLMNKSIDPSSFLLSLCDLIEIEDNQLLFFKALSYAQVCYDLTDINDPQRVRFESLLWDTYRHHTNKDYRSTSIAIYRKLAASPEAIQNCFDMWSSGVDLTESEAITASYELALRMPDKSESIIKTQRSRIKDKVRLAQFDFVSPAVSSSQVVRDSTFNALLKVENRHIEPYASLALSYLNHRLSSRSSLGYITPGLYEIVEVKRTGDIFFPKSWTRSLLAGHSSVEAQELVDAFIVANPEFHPKLKNIIMQNTFMLNYKTTP